MIRIDVQDDDLDLFALLDHFGRVLHSPCPAHVRDVDQPIDSDLHLYERTERGEVAYNTLDLRAGGELRRKGEPGILLGLLHSERDLLLLFIDPQNDTLDLVTDRQELRGMSDVPRPAHLGDVDQALDPLLELDERTVVRDGHDASPHPASDRILGRHILPWIRHELFEAQRDPLAIPVDVENLDVELLADRSDLRRVSNPTPGHVGDVEQAIHAAQVDEGSEVRNVLHHARADLSDLQLGLQQLTLVGSLRLEDHPPRDDDVPAPLVELQDHEVVLVADQIVDVGHTPERDLRAGKECVDPHQVDCHAAFDLPLQHTGNRTVVIVRVLDLLPHTQEVGFLFRQDHDPFGVLEAFEKHLDLVSVLDRLGVPELVQRDRTLRLEPDVENHGIVGLSEHCRLYDFPFHDVVQGVLVHRQELLVLLVRVLPGVQVNRNVAGRGQLEHPVRCRSNFLENLYLLVIGDILYLLVIPDSFSRGIGGLVAGRLNGLLGLRSLV